MITLKSNKYVGVINILGMTVNDWKVKWNMEYCVIDDQDCCPGNDAGLKMMATVQPAPALHMLIPQSIRGMLHSS